MNPDAVAWLEDPENMHEARFRGDYQWTRLMVEVIDDSCAPERCVACNSMQEYPVYVMSIPWTEKDEEAWLKREQLWRTEAFEALTTMYPLPPHGS